MSATDSSRNTRQRRRLQLVVVVSAVAVAMLALLIPLTKDTVASFADDVFAGGSLGASEGVQIVSSTDNANFTDQSTTNPQILSGSSNPGTVAFTTPIKLAPGGKSYAPLYLRTREGTFQATTKMDRAVQRSPSTSFPTDSNLWNTYVRYQARAMPTSTNSQCNAAVFANNLGVPLVAADTSISATVPNTSFVLPAGQNGAPGASWLVCFEFTLASGVTASPSSNGKSVFPYWIFNGQ